MSKEKDTNGHDFMLDTVNIKIRHPAFVVLKPELFDPPLAIKRTEDIPPIMHGKNLYRKWTQNTSTTERNAGVSNIALTVHRRFEENELRHYLHVEFNVAKLLFGENLHEPRQRHLGRVVEKLIPRLRGMGVSATEAALRQAGVTKVHFGKNVTLPYPLTVQECLEELYKADMGERMQVNMRDYLDADDMREYREHGESLHFHTTSRQIVFYDKLADIEKGRGASIDKEKMKKEKELREMLSRQTQLVRMEARFNDQRTVRRFMSRLLPDLGDKPITFDILFDDALCRNALLRVWQDIIGRPANQLAFKTAISPEDALDYFITREVGKKSNVHTLNHTLNSFALQQIVHRMGAKKTRKKFSKVWSSKTCGTRLDDKLRDAALTLKDLPPSRIIGIVGNDLDLFKPYGIDGNGPGLWHPGLDIIDL